MSVKPSTIAGRKADFTSIYDRPDPRGYYAELMPLDYQIPQRALPVLRAVSAASAPAGGARPILDVCCSYGINGGLLRYDVDLAAMAGQATSDERSGLAGAEVVAADRAFYADRARTPQLDVRGLDAAPHAIGYAREVGLITDGWAENLETTDASAALNAGLRDVGLVTCTGGVGYIGAATFAQILAGVERPAELWLAVFVLRMYDYAPIVAVLDDAGLVTEQLPGVTFPQRRFADDTERGTALAAVVERGLDPAGKEADGWFHADCFVTRPRAEAARTGLADLLA